MSATNASLINISDRQRKTQLINNECTFVVNGWTQISQCGKGRTWGSPSFPPQPHSRPLIFQSGQSSEPLINKESGREVNRGQWAWSWPVQQRISVSGLNRSAVAPEGTEGGSHTESLKSGVTLRGRLCTLGRHVDEV